MGQSQIVALHSVRYCRESNITLGKDHAAMLALHAQQLELVPLLPLCKVLFSTNTSLSSVASRQFTDTPRELRYQLSLFPCMKREKRIKALSPCV